MTVRIAKPSVNIREKLAELERPIGLNGQALLATETPQQAFDLLNVGRRNILINGDMRIAQRATSVTGSNGGGYTVCDRWNLFDNSGSVNIAQSSTVPTTTGFANSLQFTVNSIGTLTSTSVFTPNQQIEGFNSVQLLWGTSNAKPITVSFWCRSSVTGTYGIFVRNSAGDRYYTTTFNIASIDTWQYVTATIPGDASGTWIGGTNGIGLTVGITLRAGSSRVGTSGVWSSSIIFSSSSQVDWHGVAGATFYLTGVQLEVGKVATPFEYRSIGEELALCQRYCAKFGGGSGNDAFGSGFAHGTNFYVFVPLPVSMRSTPTLTLYGTASDISVTAPGVVAAANGTPTVVGTGINSTVLYITSATSFTTGYAVYARVTSSSTWFTMTAEL